MSVELPRSSSKSLVAASILVVIAIAAACGGKQAPAQTAAPPAPTPTSAPAVRAAPMGGGAEYVHASYVDLNSNISDLRARIAQWEAGDQQGLNGAKEKTERVAVLLNAANWPAVMAEPVAKIQQGMPGLDAALDRAELAAARAAFDPISEESHELAHAFYEEFLPTMKGMQLDAMDAHVSYMDLSVNLGDLRARLTQWADGDEQSLNAAKEKLERVEALVESISWPEPMTDLVEKIGGHLPDLHDALEAHDVAAATSAVEEVGELSHDLTHEFYEDWMTKPHQGAAQLCVQAGYMDLAANFNDLRTRVGQWEKGDDRSRDIALERAERIDAVLDHVSWPDAMRGYAGEMVPAMSSITTALEEKDLMGATSGVDTGSEALHELTHAFYEEWMNEMRGS